MKFVYACLKMTIDEHDLLRDCLRIPTSNVYDKIEPDLPISLHLTKFQILYITLARMRLDLSFSYLAYQFKVHHATISTYFHSCLFVLYSRLSSLIYWPDRNNKIYYAWNFSTVVPTWNSTYNRLFWSKYWKVTSNENLDRNLVEIQACRYS